MLFLRFKMAPFLYGLRLNLIRELPRFSHSGFPLAFASWDWFSQAIKQLASWCFHFCPLSVTVFCWLVGLCASTSFSLVMFLSIITWTYPTCFVSCPSGIRIFTLFLQFQPNSFCFYISFSLECSILTRLCVAMYESISFCTPVDVKFSHSFNDLHLLVCLCLYQKM